MEAVFDQREWLFEDRDESGVLLYLKPARDKIGAYPEPLTVLNPRDRAVVRCLTPRDPVLLEKPDTYIVREDDDAQMKCPHHQDYFRNNIRRANCEHGEFYCHFV